ncbi:MAG: hypothetical protein MRZ38_09535, partial [Muribaculaceae bacterium]|nr:hypothetical protein [Muribaculaceae bacterium]
MKTQKLDIQACELPYRDLSKLDIIGKLTFFSLMGRNDYLHRYSTHLTLLLRFTLLTQMECES